MPQTKFVAHKTIKENAFIIDLFKNLMVLKIWVCVHAVPWCMYVRVRVRVRVCKGMRLKPP